MRLVQDIGIDQNRSHLVEDDKRQEENYSINRPRRPIKIGILREVKQLACAVFVSIFHSVRYLLPYNIPELLSLNIKKIVDGDA